MKKNISCYFGNKSVIMNPEHISQFCQSFLGECVLAQVHFFTHQKKAEFIQNGCVHNFCFFNLALKMRYNLEKLVI